MNKNTILFYNTDSDGWIKNSLAVKGRIGDTFPDTYEEIKTQLEETEILNFVKEMYHVDAIFQEKHGTTKYKFLGTEYNGEGLTYIFAPLSIDGTDYDEDQITFNFSEREFITTF